MITIFEPPSEFVAMREKINALIGEFCSHLPPAREGIAISASEDLLSTPESRSCVYVLRSGVVNVRCKGHVVLQYEEGDIFGLESRIFPDVFKYSSEFGLRVDQYVWGGILSNLQNADLARIWLDLLSAIASSIHLLLAVRVEGEKEFVPRIKHFAPGEQIIQQGDLGTDVMTLIEGRADVLVDGVRVGEVLPDEIFGALGALVGIKRTATVTAATRCLVFLVTQEQFVELMKFRPRLVLKMVQDLGRALVQTNEKLVQLVGKGPSGSTLPSFG